MHSTFSCQMASGIICKGLVFSIVTFMTEEWMPVLCTVLYCQIHALNMIVSELFTCSVV